MGWISLLSSPDKMASKVDFPAPPIPTHSTGNSGRGGGGEGQQQGHSLRQHCRDVEARVCVLLWSQTLTRKESGSAILGCVHVWTV